MKPITFIAILLLAATSVVAGVYCRYSRAGITYYGRVDGQKIHELTDAPWHGGTETGVALDLSEVNLLHPSEPQVIIGCSGSYKEAWDGRTPFKTVRCFFKPPTSAGSPGEVIDLPAALDAIKVETELVIVIGSEVKDAEPEQAIKAIFGYTAGNDIVGDVESYHKIAGEPPDQEETLLPTMLKTGDNFAIFGPYIYTGVDWRDRTRRLVVQNGSTGKYVEYEHTTSNLVYPPEKIVSDLSKILTLRPGDIIFTGTTAAPIAVAGDTVTVSVQGLGELMNVVVE